MRAVARAMLFAVSAGGCAELVGADFGERELRPAVAASGAGGSVGGAGLGGEGTAGSTSATGGAGGCLCTEVPAGWEGPVALWLGDATGTPPECSVLHADLQPALDGSADLQWEPASCAICTCDAGAVTCGATHVTLYTDSTCGNACYSQSTPADTCLSVCGSSAILSLSYNSLPNVTGGDCVSMPSNSLLAKPPPSWATAGRACAPAVGSGECVGAEVCLPDPGAASGVQRPCIHQRGVAPSCPPGFEDAHVLYEGMDDTRSCSPCGCSGPTCGPFALQFVLGDETCGGQVAMPVAAPAQCANTFDIQGGPNGMRWNAQPSCTPGGGDPTGSVTADNATTFCCAP